VSTAFFFTRPFTAHDLRRATALPMREVITSNVAGVTERAMDTGKTDSHLLAHGVALLSAARSSYVAQDI